MPKKIQKSLEKDNLRQNNNNKKPPKKLKKMNNLKLNLIITINFLNINTQNKTETTLKILRYQNTNPYLISFNLQ